MADTDIIALGVAAAARPDITDVNVLVGEAAAILATIDPVLDEFKRPPLLPCRLDPDVFAMGAATDLNGAWTDLLQRRNAYGVHDPHPDGVRLAISVDAGVFQQAQRAASSAFGVVAFHFADDAMDADVGWHWPMRIGLLPDALSAVYATNLQPNFLYWPQLTDILEMGTDTSDCDILILPNTEFVNPRTLRGITAHAVIINQLVLEPLPLAHEVAVLLKASALAVMPLYDVGRLNQLVEQLGHNFAFDTAFAHDQTPDDVLIAHSGFVAVGSATDALAQLRREMESAEAAGIELPDVVAPDTIWLPRSASTRPIEVLEELGPFLPTADWTGETQSATEAAEVSRSMAPARDAMAPPEEVRHLQAQLKARDEAGTELAVGFFVEGSANTVAVRIGPGAVEWTGLDRPFPEPPPTPGGHDLSIVLRAPELLPGPVELPLHLPPSGASAPVFFSVQIPAGTDHVVLDFTVLHLGKLLQTGRYSGASGPLDADLEPPTFIEVLMEPRDLSYHGTEYLTIKIERDAVWMRGISDRPLEVKLGDLGVLLDNMQDWFDGAANLANLPGGVQNTEFVDLLRKLAANGNVLRDELFGPVILTEDNSGHVGVISDSSGCFFPVEFLYDGGIPAADAKICVAWPGKIARGQPCDCASEGLDAAVVCPSKLWCMNRIIDRTITGAVTANASRRSDTLQQIDKIIFGGSDRVEARERILVEVACRDLVGDTNTLLAAEWNEWKTGIQQGPGLLLALPHNTESVGLPALEMGGTPLLFQAIDSSVVQEPSQPNGPLVLMLGCETANPNMVYQDMIAKFLEAGAAIVVGTIAEVLPEHAAPVAESFVRAFCADDGPETLGERIRAVRREMVGRGNAMALTMTTFGDADWKFAS